MQRWVICCPASSNRVGDKSPTLRNCALLLLLLLLLLPLLLQLLFPLQLLFVQLLKLVWVIAVIFVFSEFLRFVLRQ